MANSPTTRRYGAMLVLIAALFGGWSWFWYHASGKAEAMVEGWRAREARAGRIYTCGSENISGFPFRFELNCERPSALFKSNQPPVELKAKGILVAAQVYQPNLLISEFHGPLTVATPGQPPSYVVNWKLFQSSVRGTPSRPERVSLVFERPVAERMDNGMAHTLLRADRAEIHGRMAEGSATDRPAIEVALRLRNALAPEFRPAATQPVDADVDVVLRGLSDFSPEPWPERFRRIQAAGGSIEVTQARFVQGETVGVGSGSIAINPNGRLQGQLRMTVAGLEPFLKTIGAEQMVQNSSAVDKLAGALDRLAPGLGAVARQQVGANIAGGINMIGEQTTLEGKPAVTLPLRFDGGQIFLGPIPLGQTPAFF
ncbi:MAG TPA: DUF2125 domain-containing protein [Pseudolabrys sp.]|nr:DUF2125 domain-containing protein [Pseudolabrys sp.]